VDAASGSARCDAKYDPIGNRDREVRYLHHVSVHMQRLTRLVKAFQGDIFGDALTSCPALFDPPKNEPLLPCAVFRCRLSPDHMLLFLAVLRVDYTVQRLEHGSYALLLPDGSALPTELHITVMARREWGLSSSDFDIDMLAMDAYRVYVRPAAQAHLVNISDAFSHLMDRLRTKRFCLVEASRTLTQNQRAMRRAYLMVCSGWSMDDRVLGKGAWTFCKYGELQQKRAAVPCSTCPLCREELGAADIVVQLGCGHLFHYACPMPIASSSTSSSTSTSSIDNTTNSNGSSNSNSDATPAEPRTDAGQPIWYSHHFAALGRNREKHSMGLSCWLDTPNGNTCPYCRTVM
jgi:Ring finger domain